MRIDDFPGNGHVKSVLKGMFSCRRLPHAIIIEGDRGLLRHSLAGIIAAYAICSGEKKPCDVCNECVLAGKKIHPDIAVIEPDGAAVKVDQIRKLRQEAYILPNQAEKRVFIIDEADRMLPGAQNALLKVLEEPPAFTEFILITQSAQALLPTILSRAVTLSLSPAEEDAVCRFITENHPEFSPEEVKKAAASADGNTGAALSILKSGNSGDGVTDKILAAAEGDELELLRAFQPLITSKKREDTDKALHSLLTKIQRLIILKSTGDTSLRTMLGGGLPLKTLIKMEAATRDAIERQTLNPGLPLLLTNLCACFKA